MSVIDNIMSHSSSKWINEKIEDLPNRAKFRASNAIRFLSWANKIYYQTNLPIPACFCALHATEEAVSAFVSCAKECNYKDANQINIKDHRAKSTVSTLAEKISNILGEYDVAIGHDEENDNLVTRLKSNNEIQHFITSTKLFHFRDNKGNPERDFYDRILNDFGDIENLRKYLTQVQEARNKLFYADKNGMPSGFDEPETSLARETRLTLGLIWVAIDMYRHKGEKIPLIVQALETINVIITEDKRK